MTTSAQLAKKYIQLRDERFELERLADEKKKEELAAEEAALQQFFEDEISSLKINGVTVFTRKDLFATCNDPGLLAVTEWGWLVKETVNANSLKAAVRERPEDDDGNPLLPQDIPDGCLTVIKKWRLGVRKAN
jgi:hypothetical protein